jgi:hypothetical protein
VTTLPEPSRRALLLLVASAAALVLGVLEIVPGITALFVGAALAAIAGCAALAAAIERARARAWADGQIDAGVRLRSNRIVAERIRELTSRRERLMLAGSLRSLARSLERSIVLTASPVNRPAARPQRAALLALADRLSALDRPLDPRGVLLVERLLRDPNGPLYDRARAEDLRSTLETAHRALESRR